jgi:biopolymer transport protein ExbD
MRVRRLRKHAAHLEITAFINLIVVLVPFLLSTAVFTRLAVIDLSLPAQSSGGPEATSKELKLEVVLRPDAIEVGDKIGGLIQRIPNTAKGYDLATLSVWMLKLKQDNPDKLEATLLAQPNTPYDTLVQVMDTMRMTKTWNGSKATVVDLFPAISIGDAPIPKK